MFASMVDSQERKPRSSYGVPLVHRMNASVETVRMNTLVFVCLVLTLGIMTSYFNKVMSRDLSWFSRIQ